MRGLGATLRAARLSDRRDLSDLMAATGLSRGYLGQVERGRIAHPSPPRLALLAEGYGVPLPTLMRLTGLDSWTETVETALPEYLKVALTVLTPEDWNALQTHIEERVAFRATQPL